MATHSKAAGPATTSDTAVLEVTDLSVSFPSEAGIVNAVRGVNFSVEPGKTLAIVGESGSGKSVASMAVMGLLPETAKITGSVRLGGREILGLSDGDMSKLRGTEIAMVFQDPLSALTPVYTVGSQIIEALQVHSKISKADATKRAIELLDLVGIPQPDVRVNSFPHEMSGGMRQRVVIALAIANNPKVIIADEPTTALDVTIQAQILALLKKAQQETGAAVVMITHDLGVVAGFADDVHVMYAGRAVETAPVDELFAAPRMPYTVGLLAAVPRPDKVGDRLVPINGNPPTPIDLPDACPFAPRCPAASDVCRASEPATTEISPGHTAACHRVDEIGADGFINGEPLYPELVETERVKRPTELGEPLLRVSQLVKHFPLLKGAFAKRRVGTVHAVNDVTFDIREGETFAIVGESGSGKTTTLLEVMDLTPNGGSEIVFNGDDVGKLPKSARNKLRANLQIVFQDPASALDPRFRVYDIIAEPLKAFGWRRQAIDARVTEVMEQVGLNPAHLDRFPTAFSGGQRQRIAIARALASKPKLIVLDEPVSALDVSIQAGVINLLKDLQHETGVSYLFVAHDLSVVRHLADRVAVMYLGKLVETGPVAQVFEDPQHPYTQALLSAIPIPDPELERTRDRIILRGDLPSPTNMPAGCAFAARCPLKTTLPAESQETCLTMPPLISARADEHVNACHHRMTGAPLQ